MAKKTVLEIVQDVLNDMDGDEINSISDTTEAEQVAEIVRSTYEAIITKRDWPHLKNVGQLNASGTSARPTHMTTPDDTKKVEEIWYDIKDTGETRNKWREMKWKEPDDFLRYINSRNNDDADVDVITDLSGIKLHIRTDKAPQYFTSFDDENLVFDSYNSDVDTTLQQSKTQIIYYKTPTFTVSDTHTPDLPEEAFVYLVEESKSRAVAKLRQVAGPKSEAESRAQNRWLSVNNWKVRGGVRFPNYGRKK